MNKDHISIDVSPKGGSISKIEISPNGTYLVAAIRDDQDHKIQEMVGWNVEDIKVGVDIGVSESIEKEIKDIKRWSIYVEHDNTHICVSDDKILAYIDYHVDYTNEFSK